MSYSEEIKLAEFRKIIENGFTDYFINYRGKIAMVYSDPGGLSVTIEDGTLGFKNYDEMLEANAFWGHKLKDIILESFIE